jgi:aminomethyltransferase
MVDFAGWMMPVQYSGILDEHKTVRSAVGLFDVSHMGEARLRGPRALEVIQDLVTNDVGKLRDGDALYTVVCRPGGGIVDDCIVYRISDREIFVIVNASNKDKDLAWFRERTAGRCDVIDESDDSGLVAIQGPRAAAALEQAIGKPLGGVKSFSLVSGQVAGKPVTAARTGYTGEDGFEVVTRAADTRAVWDALLECGQAHGIKPAGLGARDTLRLEAKLCLYVNDIDETTTPLEAGLGWVVKLEKGDFCGRDALVAQKAKGLSRQLVGFVMKERGIARHGYSIYGGPIHAEAGGQVVGKVTSGTTGPTVGGAVGMGYVPTALAAPGTRIVVDCRGKPAQAEIVKGPFYKRPGR